VVGNLSARQQTWEGLIFGKVECELSRHGLFITRKGSEGEQKMSPGYVLRCGLIRLELFFLLKFDLSDLYLVLCERF